MKIVLRFLALLSLGIHAAAAGEIQQVTADLPPFTMVSGGVPRGAIYDVMKEAHKRLGWPFSPRFLPWARAQAVTLDNPDTEIFGLARAPEREHLFKWIALFYVAHNAFVRLGDVAPVTLQTARTLPYIGVEMNSAMSHFLERQGFSNVSTIPDDPQCARMLVENHISAWFTFDARAKYQLRAVGYHGRIVIGPSIQNVELWLAASPGFPEQRADALRRVLAQIKADGTFARILAQYQ